MGEKIRPCPFCGKEASAYKVEIGAYQVTCVNEACPIVVRTFLTRTEDEAVKIWTKRACELKRER